MPNTQDDDFDLKQLIVDFDPGKLDPSSQPVSPIQELVQSMAAPLPQITAAAPSKASVWATMNAAKTSVQNRIEDLMQSDPILSKLKSEHYGIQVNATPFMKGKEGASKVFAAIIDHILTQSGAVKSQTQIRSYVSEMFPSHTMPRDWTKPLPAWAVKKVKQRIQNSAVPISNIQLPKVVTLSLLHKAAAAALERHKTGTQTFKPVVQVSDTAVVINGIAFQISKNIVKGEAYRQVRASMPKLLQALDSAK
jgi:hypothetical protein